MMYGGFVFSVDVSLVEEVAERFESLTPAERAVLHLIIEGKVDNAIARARNASVETVRTQTGRILSKLGVGSRTAAAVLAVTLGGFTPPLETILDWE